MYRPGQRQLTPEVGQVVGQGEQLQSGLGYGNDSRQNGPLSSRILHIIPEDEFAFYVETRPQRLTQRRATVSLISLTRPVFSAFSAAFRSLARSQRRRTDVGFAA
jgi:hypothetical protein